MAGAWNMVCWTLSVEALFYLIFPFIQTRLERRSPRGQFLFLGLMCVICVTCNTSWRGPGHTPIVGAYRYIPYAVIHVPEFLTGVALGNLFLRHISSQGRNALAGRGWWTWLAAIASLALLMRPVGAFSSLVVPAFAALLFGLADEPSLLRDFLSTPALLLGGQISYGIYLLQMPCKEAMNQLCEAMHVNSTLSDLSWTSGPSSQSRTSGSNSSKTPRASCCARCSRASKHAAVAYAPPESRERWRLLEALSSGLVSRSLQRWSRRLSAQPAIRTVQSAGI